MSLSAFFWSSNFLHVGAMRADYSDAGMLDEIPESMSEVARKIFVHDPAALCGLSDPARTSA